ncbi:MAG: hypothetical protein H6Q39_1122 [Chloroflexi bacterium]|nr:hypothetical protein [Chloroflexota bacterium]
MAKSSYAQAPAKIKVIGMGGGGCNAISWGLGETRSSA